MTTLYLALALQTPQAATPNPAALISKMFARYASAKSVNGTIVTRQSAANVTLVTNTSIAYEKASKMRLSQTQQSSTPKTVLLVSDGTKFAYTKPANLRGDQFLAEMVKPEGREAQTIQDFYPLVAWSLPDRSPVLDAIIGRADDLRYFANQLATLNDGGKSTVVGREANKIAGQWRESNFQGRFNGDKTGSSEGRYELYITDEGDLVRYVITQNFAAPAKKVGNKVVPGETIQVTTVWDATIEVNGTIPAGTFVLRT